MKFSYVIKFNSGSKKREIGEYTINGLDNLATPRQQRLKAERFVREMKRLTSHDKVIIELF